MTDMTFYCRYGNRISFFACSYLFGNAYPFNYITCPVCRTVSIDNTDPALVNICVFKSFYYRSSNRFFSRRDHRLCFSFRTSVHRMDHGKNIITVSSGIFKSLKKIKNTSVTDNISCTVFVIRFCLFLCYSIDGTDSCCKNIAYLTVQTSAYHYVNITEGKLINCRDQCT